MDSKAQLPIYRTSCILALSSTDIWITAGDQITRWNGSSQEETMCLPVSFSVNKLWGSSSDSVYAVGNGGNILYYTGGVWQQLQSGTTVDILDIWGGFNSTTGNEEIICVGSNLDTGEGPKVLSITGSSVSSLSTKGLPWDITGVWFVPGKQYYLVGGGVFQKTTLTDSVWIATSDAVHFEVGGIRGNNVNDVFTAASFGEVTHYNGSSWHNYSDQLPMLDGGLGRVAIKGNLVIAVGLAAQQAVALIGKRIE